jgi:hypothetical protein
LFDYFILFRITIEIRELFVAKKWTINVDLIQLSFRGVRTGDFFESELGSKITMFCFLDTKYCKVSYLHRLNKGPSVYCNVI